MGAQNLCSKCEVRDRALCCALPGIQAERLHRIANHRRVPRGKVVHSGDVEPDWFAVITSGVVKLVRTERDGRQQIVDLQFPSDFVGRPFAGRSPFLVEAATDLELCCFSKSPFEKLLRDVPSLERALLQRTFDELEAARKWMFVLGRLSARAKVASFIQLVAERTETLNGCAPGIAANARYQMPLSRTEMGEYLGLTIETVSRQLRRLKAENVIDTMGLRTVVVKDPAQLAHCADEAHS